MPDSQTPGAPGRLAALFDSLRFRILAIALVPTLLGVTLAATYFAHRNVEEAKASLSRKGQDMAHGLALAVEYELFVGNVLYMKKLLDFELREQSALVIGVSNGQGQWEVFSGEAKSLPDLKAIKPATYSERLGNHWLFVSEVHNPASNSDDPYLAPAPKKAIGQVAVVLDDSGLRKTQNDILWVAAGLISVLVFLAGGLAWRLSSRLSRHMRGLARTVDKITHGDLSARVNTLASGELGNMERGVNRMAETLDENRRELERRVHEATAELRDQTHTAQAAVLAKSKFLAAASHDLRQPLHAMSLLIAAMKERIGDGELRRLAEHVESSATAMQGLLNSLLDLSRLDAGAVSVKTECFNVMALFRRLENRYAPLAHEKGLSLRVVPTHMSVQSDPLLLERILGNLISNAIRYTDRGGVVVGVRLGQQESMRFEVWDSGRGVPAHLQTRIFEEYFQLDNPERDRDKGLGLGLAIVERLSRLLDCPVKVRSQPGKGSCFSVCAQRCVAPTLAEDAEAVVPGQIGQEGTIVAFVDDDESILEAMVQLFDNWGIDLAVGSDAKEVVADLHDMRREPALVLCDYRLREGATGVDAIALFRRHFGEDVPALLITGDTAPETLASIQSTGLAVLHKPLKPANLRAMLVHYLGSREPAGGEK